MSRRYISRLLFVFSFLLGSSYIAQAQNDPIVRLWYNQEKTAKIQVYKATNGKYYGKVVWLKVPEENGKLRTDKNNPDAKKQNEPLMGLVILKGFTKDGDDTYEDGTIYDPKNGKTYSCKMTYTGDVLNVRGYIGFSWIGRTTTWTKAEP